MLKNIWIIIIIIMFDFDILNTYIGQKEKKLLTQ